MVENPQHTDDFLLDDDFNGYVLKNSAQSEKKWEDFFTENPDARTDAEQAKKIILGLASLKDNTSENEIDEFHLHHTFEKTVRKYRESKSRDTFLMASKWAWRGTAAVAVIVFAVTFYFVAENYVRKHTQSPVLSEIYVPAAKQSKLTLPDGTIVWINSESRIKYSTHFNTKERNVYLEGEAYFEVAQNKKIAFKVLASGTEVKAVGTKFNVKAYPGDNAVETVLLEGKVEFSKAGSNNRHTLEMEPGDKAILSLNTGKLSVTREDTDPDVAWKDGKVIFRNTKLAEVCRTLERWYNVEITLADNTGELRSHPFTFTIEGETLPLVLEYLCQAAPLSFKTEYIDNDGEKGIEKIKYVVQAKN